MTSAIIAGTTFLVLAGWFLVMAVYTIKKLEALKEILGHADLKMTLRYAHLAPEHLRQEIEKTAVPAAQNGFARSHGGLMEPISESSAA
jgi:hypothetical protein